MSVERFKNELSSALIAFRSVYLGSRERLLSEFITAALTPEAMEDLFKYFKAFENYTQKALVHYHLEVDDLDSETKDLFTKHEIFEQLARQKKQETEVEKGELPIYSSH